MGVQLTGFNLWGAGVTMTSFREPLCHSPSSSTSQRSQVEPAEEYLIICGTCLGSIFTRQNRGPQFGHDCEGIRQAITPVSSPAREDDMMRWRLWGWIPLLVALYLVDQSKTGIGPHHSCAPASSLFSLSLAHAWILYNTNSHFAPLCAQKH